MRICPACGDRCAQGWCAFCACALPGNCGLGTCTDPTCDVCVGVAQRFPPVVRCPGTVLVGVRGEERLCRFVVNHPGPCKPSSKRTEAIEDEVSDAAWWRLT
jgi:hypothetical protein